MQQCCENNQKLLTGVPKLLTVATRNMALSRSFGARIARAAALAAALGIAGCATAPGKPDDAVKARAQARWDALVKGDIDKAYAFLSPGSRAVLDLEAYRESIKRGFWRSATVQGVQCSSADTCDVTAEIEYQYRGNRVKTPLQETWVRQESDWWYVLK